MCGRYRRTTQEEELARLYHIPIPRPTGSVQLEGPPPCTIFRHFVLYGSPRNLVNSPWVC